MDIQNGIIRRAYIVNETGHDYSSLSDIEPKMESVVLSHGNVNIFNTDRVIWEFKKVLNKSTSDDYIVLSGSIALNIIAASIFQAMHGKVNMLVWHAKQGCYVPRTVQV